jgi:RNA polymerase sigma factor (sigma-70 family)
VSQKILQNGGHPIRAAAISCNFLLNSGVLDSVAQLMASEDEEFTMLFQDFYPSLCRFLECLLGGRAGLAQDLAQESFLQLHRTAWGTLPVGEARFWLYRVARNFALNEFRKSNTRYRLFDRVVEVMRPRTRNPEEEYETRERQALVLQMLDGLPEDQRVALLLREQEQLSYKEIGQVMNASESKVKVDIFRARTALRESWAKRSRVFHANAGSQSSLGM